jgi:hypothetical protein
MVTCPSIKVMRSGENGLSRGVMGSLYGDEEIDVTLPRKALTTLTVSCLYPKPTQVGR